MSSMLKMDGLGAKNIIERYFDDHQDLTVYEQLKQR